jgi:hypothetical protein
VGERGLGHTRLSGLVSLLSDCAIGQMLWVALLGLVEVAERTVPYRVDRLIDKTTLQGDNLGTINKLLGRSKSHIFQANTGTHCRTLSGN